MVKGHVLFNLECFHHAHNALRAEKAHDIVGHGKEETAFTRVALTACATAQLVVNTP